MLSKWRFLTQTPKSRQNITPALKPGENVTGGLVCILVEYCV